MTDDLPDDVPTADEIEGAIWATMTPGEKQELARTFARSGREAVREAIHEQFRTDERLRYDYEHREELEDALTDGMIQSLDVDADPSE